MLNVAVGLVTNVAITLFPDFSNELGNKAKILAYLNHKVCSTLVIAGVLLYQPLSFPANTDNCQHCTFHIWSRGCEKSHCSGTLWRGSQGPRFVVQHHTFFPFIFLALSNCATIGWCPKSRIISSDPFPGTCSIWE